MFSNMLKSTNTEPAAQCTKMIERYQVWKHDIEKAVLHEELIFDKVVDGIDKHKRGVYMNVR